MLSIKETIEQFAGRYKEVEINRFQKMIKIETARFNEIISKEINDVLEDMIDEDVIKENFVVEVMTTPSGLYLIILKTPLLPNCEKIVEFDSTLPLENLRDELKKAHGEEKRTFTQTMDEVYRYTFNFLEIAK